MPAMQNQKIVISVEDGAIVVSPLVTVTQATFLAFTLKEETAAEWEFPDPDESPFTPNIVIQPIPGEGYPFTQPTLESPRVVIIADIPNGRQLFSYRVFLRHITQGHVIIHDPGIKNEA